MREIWFLTLGALLSLACSTSADDVTLADASSGDVTSDAGIARCPGQTLCGDECVTLMRDPQNCGACGTACASGELCSAGTCAASCQLGMLACGGSCIDPQSDNQHCGARGDCRAANAGTVCADGTLCQRGACVATLSSSTVAPASATCPEGGLVVRVGLDDGAGGGVAGDGALQDGEVRSATTQCYPFCGDAIVDSQYGEACDEGAANGSDGNACSASCQRVLDCGAYPTPQGCPLIDYAVRAVSAAGATTAGGFPITLTGVLPTSGAVQLSMGGSGIAPTTADATHVVFQAPPGVGSVPITLSVGGSIVRYATASVSPTGVYQSVLADQVPFTYPAPTVTSVSGCPTNSGGSTLDCSPSGGTVLTIVGTGFGTSVAGSSVTIGGQPCAGVSLTEPQTTLTCTLPPGRGYDLPVVVTVGGSPSENGRTASYVGPQITAVPNPPTAAVGGERVTVQGNFLGAAAPIVTLYAGDVAQSCSSVSMVSPSQLECTLPAGAGANLDVVVVVDGVPSRRFASGIRFAPPQIVPGTLRESPGGAGNTALAVADNDPRRVYFGAMRLGPDASQVQVFYGPSANPHAYRCGAVAFTADGLGCSTEATFDANNHFVVRALGQEGPVGTDALSFPAAPTATRITGCIDDGSGTSRCPTLGGNAIDVTVSPPLSAGTMQLQVGGRDCTGAAWISSGRFRCTLPPGGGVPLLSLRVDGLNARFAAGATLDYALPSIFRVSGCQDVGVTTIGCAPGNVVTIEGQRFGPDGGVVLVGGAPCSALAHDANSADTRLRCTLPAGEGMNQEVRVLDVSGRSSNVVHLSYAH